jgi:DnaJ-class molecular chaperone
MEEIKMAKRCRKCGGTGKVPDQGAGRIYTCSRCNGTGIDNTCEKCGGKGQVADMSMGRYYKCSRCHGTGKL